jgi:hypothetical protein
MAAHVPLEMTYPEYVPFHATLRLQDTLAHVLKNASVFLLGAAKSLDGLSVSFGSIDLHLPY